MAYEIYFDLDDDNYEDGLLRRSEPTWIFASRQPLNTWHKWQNPYAPKAGTVYVSATSKNPLKEVRKFVPINYAIK